MYRMTVFGDCKSVRSVGVGTILGRESHKVRAKLGDGRVVVGTLQIDKRYSFSLLLRKVVFNRIHVFGFVGDGLASSRYATRSGVGRGSDVTTIHLNNGSDSPPSTPHPALQVVAHTSSHTCAADPGDCDRAPATYTGPGRGH
jgi:hypothetical protein